MIPRFKPYLGSEEFLASLFPPSDAVERFEQAFAHAFGARHAIAFSYGRSALWAFLEALGIRDAEVIMPAYTCVVVAHAIVLSGNEPRFVDISLDDYNMDLDQIEAAINPRTRAIVATHLFGYPLNVDSLREIVRDAEARFGHRIWVVQDCAHAFGARFRGRLVCGEGDVGLFGLNISKMMTSVFGGMLTVSDEVLAAQLREWRDAHCSTPDRLKSLRRALYLTGVYVAFDRRLYGLVNWLQEATPLLDKLTKAYHLDQKIHFPPDYLDTMLAVEAAVGLAQLPKYRGIVSRRQENARYYEEQLHHVPGIVLPPLVEGATYSHFVVRVKDRRPWIPVAARAGVQLGQLIDYSVPEMRAYRHFADRPFPNARLAMNAVLNLPVDASLSVADRQRVVASMLKTAANLA